MAENKKKTNRRAKYNDLYVPGSDGEYYYKGNYWQFDLPEESLKRLKVIYCIFAGLLALMYILAGIGHYASGYIIYIALPFAIIFLPLAFAVSDVWKIATGPVKMTVRQYERSVEQLLHSTTAIIIFAAIALIGDVIFLIGGGAGEEYTSEVGFIAYCAGIIIVSTVFRKLQKKIKCIEIKPENVATEEE